MPGSVVVGLDGSPASLLAHRWATENTTSAAAVHTVTVDDEVATASGVVDALLRAVEEHDAEAVIVGHEPRERFGANLVGSTTAHLLQAATCPVVVVPTAWDPAGTAGRPVAVGVGVARGTRAAVDWIRDHVGLAQGGLLLVHALGPRSLFRPDGWLDVVAYHLDPSVLPTWIEDDLEELAEQIGGGDGIAVEVVVGPGPTGARLLEAAETASLLVVGRGEPTFVRERTMAPYLRRAITHAPCPIVVVPASDE